jgi:hypothetical protein
VWLLVCTAMFCVLEQGQLAAAVMGSLVGSEGIPMVQACMVCLEKAVIMLLCQWQQLLFS